LNETKLIKIGRVDTEIFKFRGGKKKETPCGNTHGPPQGGGGIYPTPGVSDFIFHLINAFNYLPFIVIFMRF